MKDNGWLEKRVEKVYNFMQLVINTLVIGR